MGRRTKPIERVARAEASKRLPADWLFIDRVVREEPKWFMVNGTIRRFPTDDKTACLTLQEVFPMQSILDFISGIIGVNLSDPHALPFAAPLVFVSFLGFLIGLVALIWLERERVRDEQKILDDRQQTNNR